MESLIDEFGDWKKISELGSGAFGKVTLFKNVKNDDFVAIKQCKFNELKFSTVRQRWENEVKIMKSLKHPNIIAFKPIPQALYSGLMKTNPTKLPILSMEYCTKGNLRRLLRDSKNISGLPEIDVRYILSDVVSGLSHLHHLSITHRDIKPENIVLQHCDNRINNTMYKIIDLGYAKELNDSAVSFVGTLDYLAPEMLMGITYTHAVDYWSTGILTFEVICGVHPFLPHASAVERLDYISKKRRDQICIYKSFSGSLVNSTEIRKEHHISQSLKFEIETWLQHVFQFDHNLRLQNFPNNIPVLDNLKQILNKKIIQVFSVHKLEFYSYEINNSTVLSTLKEWILRDMKINRNELTVLIRDELFGIDSDILLTEILPNLNSTEVTVFAFKKGVFNTTTTYNFPKLVKELFQCNAIPKGSIRQLLLHCIYFVIKEKDLWNVVLKSFQLYMKYIKYLTETIKEKRDEIKKMLENVLLKIDCYNNLRQNVLDSNLNCNEEYKVCLKRSQVLLSSLNSSVENSNKLSNNVNVLLGRQKQLNEKYSSIEKLILDWNMPNYLESSIMILEKREEKKMNNEQQNNDLRKQMVKQIADVIKLKGDLLESVEFINYLKCANIMQNKCEPILMMIEDFKKYLRQLIKDIENNEINSYQSLLKSTKNNEVTQMSGEDLRKIEVDNLINQNQNIRSTLTAQFLNLGNCLRDIGNVNADV